MAEKKHTFNTIGVDSIADIDKAPEAQRLAHWFPKISSTSEQAFVRPHVALKVQLGLPGRCTARTESKQGISGSSKLSSTQVGG